MYALTLSDSSLTGGQNMIRILTLLAFSLLSGCVHKVNTEDLDAWAGVPLIDLETHPFFSTLPLEKRALSNGDELWIFKNAQENTEINCDERYGGKTNCNASTSFRGCMNQFIVGGGIVKEYRPRPVNIFFCISSCRLRPASRPCG